MHAIHADQGLSEPGDLIVRASDTDVLVIMLYHCPKVISNLWMDVGHSSSNTRRYINVTKLHKEIGVKVSAALPSFHAYSGSDFTSCFYMKGKVKPFDKMVNDSQAQVAFSDLTSSDKIKAGTLKSLEKFTAKLYGCQNPKLSLNEYRYDFFEKSYRPKKNAANQLDNISGINASLLPPCEAELTTKLKRTRFVARMWTTAHKTNLITTPTVKDGFKLVDGRYEPVWYEGEMLPPGLNIIEESNQEEDDDTYDHEASSSDESSGDEE